MCGCSSPRGSSGWSKRPSGSACQVSTRASPTGAPAPSYTRPRSQNAPGVPSGTTNGPSAQSSPMLRYGPAVCAGVRARRSVIVVHVLEGRARPAAEDDVEAEAEGPLGPRGVVVVAGDHPLPGSRVAHGVEDRVLEEQRVAREVHLGDE